jgi:hypothetical protein
LWAHPRDIISQTRTLAAPEAAATADSGWHLLHVADLNCLVGAGLTHSFTSDGFYYGTAETPAITYTDPSEEGRQTASLIRRKASSR